MKSPVELIPLKCTSCNSPVPAEKDEVVWICAICGQGLQLDEEVGLVPLEIHFSKIDSKVDSRWLPFWVAKGMVSITRREPYIGKDYSEILWNREHMFFIPAFDCSLEEAVMWGSQFLHDPIQLDEGPPGEPIKITVDTRDAQALAEFIVITIEAERGDKVKDLEFNLELKDMVLWIIPFKDAQ